MDGQNLATFFPMNPFIWMNQLYYRLCSVASEVIPLLYQVDFPDNIYRSQITFYAISCDREITFSKFFKVAKPIAIFPKTDLN